MQYRDFSGVRPRVIAAVANGIVSRSSASREDGDIAAATSGWFADFLIDRATHKPSDHMMKAYRQDFTAVADLLSAGPPSDIALTDITKKMMRAAFAAQVEVQNVRQRLPLSSGEYAQIEYAAITGKVRRIRYLSVRQRFSCIGASPMIHPHRCMWRESGEAAAPPPRD